MEIIQQTYKVSDIAQIFGVCTPTVRKWISEFGLPAKRFGKAFLVDKDDLQRWIKSRPTIGGGRK